MNGTKCKIIEKNNPENFCAGLIIESTGVEFFKAMDLIKGKGLNVFLIHHLEYDFSKPAFISENGFVNRFGFLITKDKFILPCDNWCDLEKDYDVTYFYSPENKEEAWEEEDCYLGNDNYPLEDFLLELD